MALDLNGETTCCDYRVQVGRGRPKNWLKCVSTFANSEGGTVYFGVDDDGNVAGVDDAKGDIEYIPQMIQSRIDPPVRYQLDATEENGKTVLLSRSRRVPRASQIGSLGLTSENIPTYAITATAPYEPTRTANPQHQDARASFPRFLSPSPAPARTSRPHLVHYLARACNTNRRCARPDRESSRPVRIPRAPAQNHARTRCLLPGTPRV